MTQTPLAPSETFPPPSSDATSSGANQVPVWKSVAVLCLGGLVWMAHLLNPTPLIPSKAGVVMHLPGFVNVGSGFVGENAEVTEPERRILPKDTEFARKNYRDLPLRDEIFCSIVLSGAMQQSIHRPEVCLVAQGWSIANQEDVPIQLDSGHRLTVRNLTIKKVYSFDQKQVTLTDYNMYWFVGENTTTPYHFMRIFLSSWDRIVHNRAHRWAYVTVSSPITKNLYSNGLDAGQTKALLISFIKYVVPHFQKSEMPADGSF